MLAGILNGATSMEKNTVLPQRISKRITMWFRNCTSGYIYEKELKTEPQRDICTPIFIAALFTIGKR